ncbi:MAG: tRNA (adenine-N1)-methyltransferase [Candidatus Verstraetearchaeota archaeon]|nr:tRNA (adenine-N1)-methyltransferase [Candidatus Verstraetearchaeota archaeon]
MTIEEGQEILLYVNEKKSWIVTVESGKKFHTHKGIVDLGELIGKQYGTELKTTLGLPMKAMPVDYLDHLERVSRKTQIIYPKDIALITLLANVRPGSRVVECGTGSGSLTSYLATHVQPDGMVYTYEMREEFQRIARRNLERMGLIRNVEMKLKDINEGIDERDVDAVVLDMATPWQVVDLARDALRTGGRLVSFSPTINQVEKTVEEMRSKGFLAVKALELLMRTYKVKANETRPEMIMVGHTGYIVSGRKG